MPRTRFSRLAGRGQWWRYAVTLLLLAIAIGLPRDADAHAALDRSDPEANAILSLAPAEVRIWFTEPLEEIYSAAELYDANGNRIETEPYTFGEDDHLLSLPLPADLPNGTYTIAWRNISAFDGHPNEGLLTFTIGTQRDLQTPAPPETTDFGGPSTVVEAIVRWLGFLGITALVGTLITWFVVIRPAFGAIDEGGQRAIRSAIWGLLLSALGIALVGSLFALVVQMMTVAGSFSFSAMVDLLGETSYGRAWLMRVAMLLALGVALGITRVGLADVARRVSLLICGLALVALIPYALNSHAAAIGTGRAAAIANDVGHMAAASVWVGGLIALAVTLFLGLQNVSQDRRGQLYAQLVPRFSTLAMASVIVLVVSGFYASWLQVGNLSALFETDYGQTLIVKLALTALLLVLGAVNLLVIGPRLRVAAASAGVRLTWTVGAEVLIGIAVLVSVGVLTSLPTARGVVESESGRTVYHLTEGGTHAVLYITPGAAGPNRYTVDVDTGPDGIPAASRLYLRATPAGELSGTTEIELQRTVEQRFEATGSELGIVGDWELELLLQQPGKPDWRMTTMATIFDVPPEERIPSAAPRFAGWQGAAWAITLLAAVPLLVIGLREARQPLPLAFSAALIVVSLIGLLTVEEPGGQENVNPVVASASSLEHGEHLFGLYCVDCHGENATGDGPVLSTQQAANADLTAAHVEDHTDAELHQWILNGIGGTIMPGFKESITEDDAWHLVNYVRSLREGDTADQ